MEPNVSQDRNVKGSDATVGPIPTPTPGDPDKPPTPGDPDNVAPDSGDQSQEPPPAEPPKEKPPPKMYTKDTYGINNQGGIKNLYQVINGKVGSEGAEQGPRKPLLDFTTVLPPQRNIQFDIDGDDLEDFSYKLRSDRLVLVSCANDHLAFDCAQSLVTRLDIEKPPNRRLLNFKRLSQEKGEPSIYYLREIEEQSDEIVIVVDAVGEGAQSFLDHVLFTRDSASTSLRQELTTSKISMICIVNGEDVATRLSSNDCGESYEEECPFPHWNIPFLKPLLRRHFPNDFEQLESLIMAARERWDRDERKFRFRIETLIRSGKLRDFLAGLSTQESFSPEKIFPGDGEVQDHVVYCGAFFPNLNPREFQRIVSFLLKDKTTSVTVPSTNRKEDGSIEKIEVQEEQPMVNIWRKSMDKIQRDCLLTSCLTDESQVTIDFRDNGIRQKLRDYIKLEYSGFHTCQFELAHNYGLLFDQSASIADNMIELAAEMINLDREYLGHQWFHRIFSLLENPPDDLTTDPVFNALSTTDIDRIRPIVYRRTSQLLRKLSEQYQAEEFVNNLIERLIQNSLFFSAFQLTKGLRTVSNFDEFYWLKQLVERGTEPVRILVRVYLRVYFNSIGPRVYLLLNGLNAWIKLDPQSDDYSISSLEALKLIFVFGSSIRFDSSKPGPHYLFVFPDRKAAERDLGILVRHLFHPWMKKALEEFELNVEPYVVIGIFITEWAIAMSGDAKASSESSTSQGDGAMLGPAETFQVLLEQILKVSTPEQQQILIEFWMWHSEFLLALIIKLAYDAEERDELVLRRNRLDELLTHFRQLAVNTPKTT